MPDNYRRIKSTIVSEHGLYSLRISDGNGKTLYRSKFTRQYGMVELLMQYFIRSNRCKRSYYNGWLIFDDKKLSCTMDARNMHASRQLKENIYEYRRNNCKCLYSDLTKLFIKID